MTTKSLTLLFALILTPALVFCQQRKLTINSGNLFVPGNVGVTDFRVTLDQNVTSFEIAGPRPDANNQINVLFVQDATGGRTVSGYASNLVNTSDISIASEAGATTLVKFLFDQTSNQWIVTSGGSHTSGTVAKVDLTSSTANVALTTLYAVPESGCFRLTANLFFTNPTGYSTLEADYEFTQNGVDSGNGSVTPILELGQDGINALDSATGFRHWQRNICADAGTPIKWALTYTSGGTGDGYDIHLRLEKLQ